MDYKSNKSLNTKSIRGGVYRSYSTTSKPKAKKGIAKADNIYGLLNETILENFILC